MSRSQKEIFSRDYLWQTSPLFAKKDGVYRLKNEALADARSGRANCTHERLRMKHERCPSCGMPRNEAMLEREP
jgi:hypothetical protein